MDFQMADKQADQLRQQSQEQLQKMQALAKRLRSESKDEATGREQAMDLREIAMEIKNRDQSTLMLIQQMAQYIQQLEKELHTHPQPSIAPRGWFRPHGMMGGMGMGGGLMSSVMSGLGLGAGFGMGEEVVDGIFDAF